MSGNRQLAAIAAITVGLLLGGCGARTHSIAIQLAPAKRATVQVRGDAPFVTVHNEGPGRLDVTFGETTMPSRQRSLTSGMATGRTVRDRSVIELRTGDEAGARVLVKARDATGIAMDLAVPES